jgi:ABC-type methionine transport system permease subunit
MARVTRWMIESGHAGIIGGKGLADLKRELGYQPVPQWSVARRLGR